jgi:hypothetical protein
MRQYLHTGFSPSIHVVIHGGSERPSLLSKEPEEPDNAGTSIERHWRERFLSDLSHPKCARIATTPATVRPAHGAAIAGVEDRESGVTLISDPQANKRRRLV